MAKLTADAITTLHDKIQATTAYETLNLSVTDPDSIVGTIVVDGSNIFHVQAKVIGGPADNTAPGSQTITQLFTVLCGISSSNGSLVGNSWQYTVPHPFNGLEFITTVTDATTKQEQHVDVVKHIDYAIINIAQAASKCYDVTFIGYVA